MKGRVITHSVLRSSEVCSYLDIYILLGQPKKGYADSLWLALSSKLVATWTVFTLQPCVCEYAYATLIAVVPFEEKLGVSWLLLGQNGLPLWIWYCIGTRSTFLQAALGTSGLCMTSRRHPTKTQFSELQYLTLSELASLVWPRHRGTYTYLFQRTNAKDWLAGAVNMDIVRIALLNSSIR